MALKDFKETVGDGFLLVVWELEDGDEAVPHGILKVNGMSSFRTFQVAGEGQVHILGSIIEGEYNLMNDGVHDNLIFDMPSIKHSFDGVLHVKPQLVGPGKVTVAMTVKQG